MGFMWALANQIIKKRNENNKSTNNKIRVIYVKMHPFSCVTDSLEFKSCLAKEYYISALYQIPDGMTKEEAYQIISYLIDNSKPGEELDVIAGETASNACEELPHYGFHKLNNESYEGFFNNSQEYNSFTAIEASICTPIDGVEDLFVVGGNPKYFQNSFLKDGNTNWYSRTTDSQIEEICNNHNITMPNTEHSM